MVHLPGQIVGPERGPYQHSGGKDRQSTLQRARAVLWLSSRMHYTNRPIGVSDACTNSLQVRRLANSMHSKPFAIRRLPEACARLRTGPVRLQLLAYSFGIATSMFGQVPSPSLPSEPVESPLIRHSGITIYGGQQLSYEIIDGMAIHDGDMVLGTAEEVAAADPEWRSGKHEAPFGLERRELSPEGGDLLWPGGIVPFVISEGFEPEAVQDIRAAIQEWNAKTVITLVDRTTESDYVRFVPRSSTGSGTTCSANVGRRDGERFVWLARPSGCGVGTTVHEIGHSIGLRHEHQRFDRDEYVFISDDVRYGPSGYSYTNNRPVGGSYDYASIMHYRSVETIPPGMPVRSANWLSSGDVDGVARLYGTPPTATTISTNPPGLEIRVDGERVVTPASFDWEPGSKHVLQVPSAQSSGTERYVFGRWSDEGGFRRVITADPGVTWYEANFIVQKQLRACAVPPEAGEITVLPESSGGFHSLRAPFQIEATADPDAGLEFVNWDTSYGTVRNGSSKNPVPGLVVSTSRSWTAYQANFAAAPLFRIDSNLSGFRIIADRRSRYLPWTVPAAAHSRGIVVEAPEVVPISSGVRYRFNGWSDGSPRLHRVRVPPDGGSLSAKLTPEYALFLRARSPRAAMPPIQVSPMSSRGYFEGDTQVVLTAIPQEGVHFAGWVGNVSGTELVKTVEMDSVKNVWAVFTPNEPLRSDESVEIVLPASDEFDLRSSTDGYHLLLPPDAVELTVSFESATPGAEVDLFMASGREVLEERGLDGSMQSIRAEHRAASPGASERITIDRNSTPPLRESLYSIALGVQPSQTEIRGTLTATMRRSGITQVIPRALALISTWDRDPARQTIQLTHNTTSSTRYRIESSLPWISASPQEWVQTEPGTSTVTVTASPAGQGAGTHQGKLTVVRVSEEDTPSGTVPIGVEIPVVVSPLAPSASRESTPKVSRVSFFSSPEDGEFYRAGERIRIAVYFSAPIEVVGSPLLALTMGDQTHQVVGRGSVASRCGGNVLVSFTHEVQADDVDLDGFSVAANALALNGGHIRSLTGADAELDLGRHAFSNAAGQAVDGSRPVSPTVERVLLRSRPHDGTAYGAGEWIEAWVYFSQRVQIEGNPQLAITVGSQTRQAALHARGLTLFGFRYLVQASDMDADGVSIAPNALTLNGGSIRSRDGADANLDLGRNAIANADGHAVDGSTAATLRVRGVGITSRPRDRTAYGTGESVLAYVSFTGPVEVDGSPQLELMVGDHMRKALFDRVIGDSVFFRYIVQAEDEDDDGIGIAPNAVMLNGGSITSPAGGEVNLDIGRLTIFMPERHKVRGGG